MKHDITTAKGLAKLKPSKVPYYQKVSKGLAVGYYYPGTGTKSWVARYRQEGKYKTEVLPEAENYAQAAIGAAAFAEREKSGEPSPRQKKTISSKGDMTVETLVYEYLDGSPEAKAEWDAQRRKAIKAGEDDPGRYISPNEAKKGKRYSDWRYTSERLTKRYVFRFIKNRKISTLTDDDITELQNRQLTDVSPETINRGTVTLRASLNYAVKKGYIQEAVWKGVPTLEEKDPQDKANSKEYFDLKTREAFLEGANKYLFPLAKTMHLTGARPAEVRNLTVADVHIDKRLKSPYLRLMTYKGARSSGTARKFPLAGKRLEFFTDLVKGRKKDELLFSTATGLPWDLSTLR